MRRFFFACAVLLAAASLGGCATTQTPQTPASAVAIVEMAAAQYFSLNGRISVRVNDRVDSGQIRWHRSAEEERIGLYSPLGSQVAELVSDKRTRVVTLRQGKETLTAATVADLTQSLLGIPLDLDRVAGWVQGAGLRENEIVETTLANGDVWRVTAERYQPSGDYRFASRVIAINRDTVVRLVVDEWMPL